MKSFDCAALFRHGFLVEQKVGSGEADPAHAGGTALEHPGIFLEELEEVAGEDEKPAASQQGAGEDRRRRTEWNI